MEAALREGQEKQAWVSALRFLTATPKSRRGLKQKLEERGFAREIVEKILGRLEEEKLLDDRLLAQSLFQSFSNCRPSGRQRIRFEMEKRGIGEGLIEELLQKYSPEEEREKALELARDKWGRWQRFDTKKRRKKLYDFLVRRGFDFTVSREVVAKVERGE